MIVMQNKYFKIPVLDATFSLIIYTKSYLKFRLLEIKEINLGKN